MVVKRINLTIVNKRLENFTGGNQEANPVVNKKFQPSIKNLVGAKISAADISGAVRIMSSSDKVLPPSEEVVNKLKKANFNEKTQKITLFWHLGQ